MKSPTPNTPEWVWQMDESNLLSSTPYRPLLPADFINHHQNVYTSICIHFFDLQKSQLG